MRDMAARGLRAHRTDTLTATSAWLLQGRVLDALKAAGDVVGRGVEELPARIVGEGPGLEITGG